jgi:hypothetical protein
MVDHRYRFTIANSLTNVIVTARAVGTGEEPPGFGDQVEVIIERQVARLADSAR